MIPQILLAFGRSPQRWVASPKGDYRTLRLSVLQESEHCTYISDFASSFRPLLKLGLIPAAARTLFILSIM